MRTAIELFMMGMTASLGPCLVFCGPIVPYIAATRQGWREGLGAMLIFSFTLLVVYSLLGLSASLLGRMLIQWFHRFGYLVNLFGGSFILALGLLIILGRRPDHRICQVLRREFVDSSIKSSILLGLVVGILPCLPLLAILTYITLKAQNLWQGALYGMAFGMGKFISPLIPLGVLASTLGQYLLKGQRMFRLFSIVCGLILIFIGVNLMINPERGEAGLVSTQRGAREAMFYQRLDNQNVQCGLCPRRCLIPEGKRGFCRVRENRGGTLVSLVYGRPCSVDFGPIEKAPLYHFIPGHERLCLATVSCNLRCKFCQNWHISQVGPGELREYNLSPEEVVKTALKYGVKSISFTYTEPTVFYEYIYDISKLAREKGIKTSIVSNGYINPEPLKRLLGVLDAVKIDLKAFTERFYREVSQAKLEPVLKTLKVLKEEGTWFEIVNLVIPTLNDDPKEIKRMCQWIKENLGEDVPLHFTRFTPAYRLTSLPMTPVKTLEMAVKIAHGVGLKYVYIGNVPGHKYNSTFCPKCGKILIERNHFTVLKNNIREGRCQFCRCKIPGIW